MRVIDVTDFIVSTVALANPGCHAQLAHVVRSRRVDLGKDAFVLSAGSRDGSKANEHDIKARKQTLLQRSLPTLN